MVQGGEGGGGACSPEMVGRHHSRSPRGVCMKEKMVRGTGQGDSTDAPSLAAQPGWPWTQQACRRQTKGRKGSEPQHRLRWSRVSDPTGL